MLRVAHLTSVHSALDHRIFRKECRSLARAGYAVTVIGPHGADAEQEKISIRAIAKPESRLLRMTQTAWRVYRAALRENADVYHFHDPELIPMALLLRTHGKKVIYDVHEDYPKDIYYKPYLPGLVRRVISSVVEKIELTSARHFSAIVAVTPVIAERFTPANKKTVIVRNFPYQEELVSVLAGPWDTRRVAAAYVGTISPQRGICEIVQAVGLLPEILGVKLEIAGEDVPPGVRQLAGWQRVCHHGILDQKGTYDLLRQVRVGLSCQHPIPTFVDSIPVKIFEYMGAGLPIIVSNFPLWRQMFESSRCAIFVNPLDTQEIAAALEFLLSNPAEAEAMGKRGQAAVASQFNWNSESKTLVELYAGLIGAPCVA
ncbi:MAG: glycosyltransferase family 4 protein [Candidatus Acidiferrum sp.]